MIKNAIKHKNRIICVGTTVFRALESSADKLLHQNGKSCKEINDETKILIFPGYEFKIANGLVTNFHLPQSTLLMLVSAFTSKLFIWKAYQEAINNEYRFYSFGDSMLII